MLRVAFFCLFFNITWADHWSYDGSDGKWQITVVRLDPKLTYDKLLIGFKTTFSFLCPSPRRRAVKSTFTERGFKRCTQK